MVTDNFPVDFIYISRRLVERLALQHEAGRPRWLVETMGTPDSMPVAVTAKQRPVNYAN
jgi:hypothetical protein